jgi:hypothetical protein
MGWLRKIEGDTGKGVDPSVMEKKSPKGLEALWEFLTANKFPDGSERLTGTINLFAEGIDVKCSLSDRAQSLIAFMKCESLLTALHDADAKLRNGTLDWRRVKESKKR